MVAMLALSSPPDLATMGRETMAMLRREFYIPSTKLYAEHADRKQPAFNWGVGVMLSALNAAARHDDTYQDQLREYADATRIYWNQGGYDVLPAPKPLDRYYDDNAWMVLALVETFEILGDRKYLTWAEEALSFALSGEAKDGGIYWRESDKASRNTCSNAPTAAACLAVAKHTNDAKLRTKAHELYDWTRKHFQDPVDHLYWDNLSNTGKLDKTKWSYNTALMIHTAARLGLKEDVAAMMPTSHERWLRDGRFQDVGKFAHLLLEAWLIADKPRPEYTEALTKLYAARSERGFVPGHWGRTNVDSNPEILDQAAFARACFVLAKP